MSGSKKTNLKILSMFFMLFTTVAILIAGYIVYDASNKLDNTLYEEYSKLTTFVKECESTNALYKDLKKIEFVASNNSIGFMVFDVDDDNNLCLIVPKKEEQLQKSIRDELEEAIKNNKIGQMIEGVVNNKSGITSQVGEYLKLDKSKIKDIKVNIAAPFTAKLGNFIRKSDFENVCKILETVKSKLEFFEKSKEKDYFIFDINENKIKIYSLSSLDDDINSHEVMEFVINPNKENKRINSEDVIINLMMILSGNDSIVQQMNELNGLSDETANSESIQAEGNMLVRDIAGATPPQQPKGESNVGTTTPPQQKPEVKSNAGISSPQQLESEINTETSSSTAQIDTNKTVLLPKEGFSQVQDQNIPNDSKHEQAGDNLISQEQDVQDPIIVTDHSIQKSQDNRDHIINPPKDSSILDPTLPLLDDNSGSFIHVSDLDPINI